MEWVLGLVSTGFLTLLLVVLHHLCKGSNTATATGSSVPEPPGGWPILGHLLLLNSRKTPRFRIISELSDEYGPVFALRLGLKRVVFVNSWETAKECFTVNDKALAARPPSTALGRYICHNDAYFGIASGEYWKEMRKITMTDLLSPTKLTELKHLQVSEVNGFIKELHDASIKTNKIKISEWFARLSVNMIVMLIARKRYPCNGGGDEAAKVHTAIEDLLYAFGLPVISDAIPSRFLEWLDPQGHIRMMKRICKQLDEVVEEWVEEHRLGSMPHHQRGEQDFIDVLLCEVGQGKLNFDKHAKEVVIGSTIESIIVGAVDTTSVTLTWIFSLLLNHQQVMKRAKEEIDRVVGSKRWVEDLDIENLVYLSAVIKETMRLYPAGSLTPPHMSVEDCIISGYRVPKGTTLFCNTWKLQRDPRVWEDPTEFRPERFMGGGLVKDYTYMPFGVGRRMCPGKDLVIRVMPLTVARLLQGFELWTLSGQLVDMSEGFGAILHKATPLEVVVTPRFLPHMY